MGTPARASLVPNVLLNAWNDFPSQSLWQIPALQSNLVIMSLHVVSLNRPYGLLGVVLSKLSKIAFISLSEKQGSNLRCIGEGLVKIHSVLIDVIVVSARYEKKFPHCTRDLSFRKKC